jgi:SmpA / OmlA family
MGGRQAKLSREVVMDEIERPASSPFRSGCIAVVTVALLSCCLGPPMICRLSYGRWGDYGDFSRVKPGMTPEQVIDLVGPPHERIDRGGYESWTYREGFIGLPTHGVTFTAEGVVNDWYVH